MSASVVVDVDPNTQAMILEYMLSMWKQKVERNGGELGGVHKRTKRHREKALTKMRKKELLRLLLVDDVDTQVFHQHEQRILVATNG